MINQTRILTFAAVAITLLPLLMTEPLRAEESRGGEIHFTKWITSFSRVGETSTVSGKFTGLIADLPAGSFSAEVLQNQTSAIDGIGLIEAVYKVTDGPHSFTALVKGGTNNTGLGLLEGVILDGWRTGSRLGVQFHRSTTECPPGVALCYVGTIRIDGRQ